MTERKLNNFFVIIISLLVAVMLTITTFPLGPFAPDWIQLFLIYWIIALPLSIGMLSSWIIGLLVDVVMGSTLGISQFPILVVLRFFAITPDFVIPIIFLTQFWIFASLIISTKQILNLKSSFKAFGIVLLSFLIIGFLSISFVMSRMNALPISNIT